jgi:glucans biosynthesis protein C
MNQLTSAQTTAPQGSAASRRLHYLDWLRVLVILGVFVAHVFLPFAGGTWLINAGETLVTASLIAVIGNQFGMPLLFLVSGAGTYFALRKRSGRQFSLERAQRLLIPYLVGVILLSPIQAYYEAIQHGRYSGGFIQFLPQFFTLDRFNCCDLTWAGAYGYHLWFLVFLFVYSLVALPLFLFLGSQRGAPVLRWFGVAFKHPVMLMLFAVPMGIAQVILRASFPAYLGWADFVWWGLFFVAGYIIFANHNLIQTVRRSLWVAMVVIGLTVIAIVFLAVSTFIELETLISLDQFGKYLGEPATALVQPALSASITNAYIGVMFIMAFNAWALVILLVSLAMRFLDFTNRRLLALSDISMPFYVIHHPVIVIVGFYVVQMGLPTPIMVIVLGLLAFVFSIGFIGLFISPYDVLRLPLGMRLLAQAKVTPARHLHRYQIAYVASFAATVTMMGYLVANPLQVVTDTVNLDDGWVFHETAPGAAACVQGEPYAFFSRQLDPASQNRKLLVYFQTGGACWDAATCGPNSILFDRTVDTQEFSTYGGIFNFEHPENPVKDYDFLFVAYCSGDLHTGSMTQTFIDPLGAQLTMDFQGARNTHIVLDWMAENYAEVDELIITGSSAGAIGSIFWASQIIELYPEARAVQIGDGYVGVAPEGWIGPEIWGSAENLPSAIAPALQATADYEYVPQLYLANAKAHPEVTFAQYSDAGDVFQIAYYNVGGGVLSQFPDLFWESLVTISDSVDNFASYVAAGVLHTAFADDRFYQIETNGVRLVDWFTLLRDHEVVPDVWCERGTLSCP